MAKVRNHHFDNIKALLIFLVVFGHIIEPLRDIQIFKVLYFIIYSFHMPLFIFLAGFFAKPTTKGLKNTFLILIKYEVIYAICYILLFAGSSDMSSSIDLLGIISYVLQPIWVLWFLLSLMSWRLLLIAYERYPLTIIVIIAAIITFNFIPFNFRILSLGRTLTFFPYFLLGYLAKKNKFNFQRIELNRTFTLYIVGLLLLFWTLYSVSISSELLYGAASFNDYTYNLIELTLFKLNTYLVAISAGIIIFNLVPKRELWISQIGEKTHPIFIWHPIIIWILIRFNFFEQIRTFSSLASLIILILLSSFITLTLKDRRV